MSCLQVFLLLLAICRYSSGEEQATEMSWTMVDLYAWQNMGNNSPFSLPDEKKVEQYGKFVLGNLTEHQSHYLNELLGNTIYAMILDRLGLYESLPVYYKAALDNGVLCEVNSGLIEGAVRTIQYESAGPLSVDQRASEREAAKDPAIGLEYGRPRSEAEACFSHFEKVLLYCAALKFKQRIVNSGATRKTCKNEIIDSIQKNSSATFLGFYFDDNNNKNFVRAFDNIEAIRGGFLQHLVRAPYYCLACETEAEEAVRSLFAANALRWTLEGYVIQEVFNSTHRDIESACAVETFKSSEIGKCACSKGTGIAFCTLKARAEYYKKIGFLTCDVPVDKMSFNTTARPDSLPPFACLSDSHSAAEAPECDEYRKMRQ